VGRDACPFYWEEKMKDKINPDYYTQGIDCIDYITSKNMSFLEGNVVKYVTRHRMKNGLEDLHKAQWYLTRLIQDYNEKGEVSETSK
jgi:hypothetical protein